MLHCKTQCLFWVIWRNEVCDAWFRLQEHAKPFAGEGVDGGELEGLVGRYT